MSWLPARRTTTPVFRVAPVDARQRRATPTVHTPVILGGAVLAGTAKKTRGRSEMAKFHIKLKLQGLELEVDGTRDDLPVLREALAQQFSGLLGPATDLADGQV